MKIENLPEKYKHWVIRATFPDLSQGIAYAATIHGPAVIVKCDYTSSERVVWERE